MATHRGESEYLYGMHDPGGEHLMREKGVGGWVLVTEEIRADPNDQGGGNYKSLADQGFGVIVRLNYGYYPNGTIPHSSQYENFARRCANFVRASQGAHIWIIGNEMNLAAERPGAEIDWGRGVQTRGADDEPPSPRELGRSFDLVSGSGTRGAIVNPGETITPALYARCYQLCRDAIHGVAGHEDDLVLIGSVAPWNIQTTYDGNPSGDWVRYFQDLLNALGPSGCDGITIHTYTHGTDPALVESDGKMNPPFQNRHFHFRTYRDFMNAIPGNMRHLPVYITEADEDEPWANTNNGWVQRAYAEIDRWNKQQGNQQIRALVLYRWPSHDRWSINDKPGVHDDFRAAMDHHYKWNPAAVAPPPDEPPSLNLDSPVLGAPSGKRERVASYLKRGGGHEYTAHDVDLILSYYWRFGPEAGVDPFLAVAQSLYDTGAWRAPEAARPHRNPARVGRGGAPGGVQSFASWEQSAKAHIEQLKSQGAGKRLRDLRGDEYAEQVVALAKSVAKG